MGEQKNKTKIKIISSLDGVTCPEFHWGLINVRRKPENPESDSWEYRWSRTGILKKSRVGGGFNSAKGK